jgi:hypothetical protein
LGPDLFAANLATYTAPTLQYVMIFAIGLRGGSWLGESKTPSTPNTSFARRSIGFGCALVASGAALYILKHWMRDQNWAAGTTTALDRTLQISMKTPPSPAYLIFYGGTALIVIGIMLAASESRSQIATRITSWLAVLGRASLFIFVLQYFLYWTMPDLIGVHPGPYAGPLFLVNVAMLWCAARMWNEVNGQRFVSFGIHHLRRANES